MIIVYLRPNYDFEPDRRYPVLYLHDGQNVFDAETAWAARAGRILEFLFGGRVNGAEPVA